MEKKNIYSIMREFHKWEKEPAVISACEKLVQVQYVLFVVQTKKPFVDPVSFKPTWNGPPF